MAAVYTLYSSPHHQPVEDHLPTLIVTPHGKPQQILYTYLHTNYNRENYLLTPSPQGDLCVAKLFPPPTGQPRPSGGKSASEGHGTAGATSSAPRTVKCEASRNFRWSITNSGVLTPTYKCTLPADDGPGGMGEEQPLFQISKTNPSSPFWTMWYYAYAGHLIPPKRIQFGHISKSITPDGKPVTGGGTRVTITGKTDDEKAVWKTLGDGNEDMVEWAVICAALHVLDDEIVKAAEAAGIRIGVMPGSNMKSAHHSSTPPPMPHNLPRPQLHPTGQSATRAAVPQGLPPVGGTRGPPPGAGPPGPGAPGQGRPPGPPGPGPGPGQNGMPMQMQNGMPPHQQQQHPGQDPRMDPRAQAHMRPPQQQMPPQQQPPRPLPQAGPSGQVMPPPRQHMPSPGPGGPGPGQMPPPHMQQQQPPHPQQQQQQQQQQQMPPPQERARLMQARNGPRPQQTPSPDQFDRTSPPYNPRPGPNAQQGRPNGFGQPPPQYANGHGGPSPGHGLPAPGQAGAPPPRAVPPVSLNALRSKQPLPAPGGGGGPPNGMPAPGSSSLPDPRMFVHSPIEAGFAGGPPNGHPAPFAQQQHYMPSSPQRERFTTSSSAPPGVLPGGGGGSGSRLSDPPMSHPPPRRSSNQASQMQPPPHRQSQPELSEEDTVDSVAFMLGTTALNDVGALNDEEIGQRRGHGGPVSSHPEPLQSQSRVGRLLRQR